MSAPRAPFALGISDFRMLRRDGFRYVDKTALVEDVLTEPAQVLLAPRPRRFGKTLNLSMLRYFFEKSAEDRSDLFTGLDVAASAVARPHFQRYPVIYLSLKDVKPTSWENCLGGIAGVLAEAFGEHAYLVGEGSLDTADSALFTAIHEQRASQPALASALKLLSRLLARHHGERVVILIDEYDSPIHAGYTNRYYDEVVAFFRDFLSGGLKDNPHLFKGMLTGILRVARESLFSGLNNIDVFSILRPRLATRFGFTEAEVSALCEDVGQPALLEGIRGYYNGYLFGGQAIYNPWSVLSFFDNEEHLLQPYWIDTSSNDLVREQLVSGPEGVQAELEVLLAGGTVDKPVSENIVLRDVSPRSDVLWSFLLFTGYLKPTALWFVEGERWARLAVPNTEVAIALRGMARAWLATQVGGDNQLRSLLDALLRGDAPTLEKHLSDMVKVNLSYFDAADPEPERFYHGLVVGLLAGLGGGYEVRSNRESGFGRCDVLVLPKVAGKPGVALELKRVVSEGGETKEKALAAALRQIRARDYTAELRARGASPIHEMAAVFEGKRAYVRVAGERKTAAGKKPAGKKGAGKKAAPAGRRGRAPRRA
jgi:hypothetical protein